MIVPDTAPLLCQGCQEVFPPDPPNDKGATQLGYVCPLCDGPLTMVGPATQISVQRMPDGTYVKMADIAEFMRNYTGPVGPQPMPSLGGDAPEHPIHGFGPTQG
jgi:hypothetical protein